MTRTANDIKRACAQALACKDFEPHDGLTFCNIALYDILSELGIGKIIWNVPAKRVMLANEIADTLENTCRELSMTEAALAANSGRIVISALKAPYHGHCAVIYPFPGLYTSGKWGRADVPCVANIGKDVGVMPLNWAFGALPRLWLVDL